jgi:hypothetical protein
VIVTSCHSSDQLASAEHIIFLSSNNFTTPTLQFLQIDFNRAHPGALMRQAFHKNNRLFQRGARHAALSSRVVAL